MEILREGEDEMEEEPIVEDAKGEKNVRTCS
jgi:hypothetical protein